MLVADPAARVRSVSGSGAEPAGMSVRPSGSGGARPVLVDDVVRWRRDAEGCEALAAASAVVVLVVGGEPLVGGEDESMTSANSSSTGGR